MTRPAARISCLLACILSPWSTSPSALACDDCPDPTGNISAPTSACQSVSGSTDATCTADVWRLDLVAGRTYVFTLCDTACGGATASFDTLLRLWDPSCPEVSANDDTCGSGRSEITYAAAVTGTHAIEVTGARVDRVGTYTLGYRSLCGAGGSSCAAPDAVLTTPTTTCQTLSDGTGCQDEFHHAVDLVQGQAYTFTLCDATCAGAGADFDSAVELLDPTGAPVASSSTACGDDGEVVYETDPATGGGTYCVRVINEGGGGAFTLGWRVACQPPSDLGLTPTLGGTTTADCAELEAFVVTAAGTGPYDWSWSIAVPAGGSAAPVTGAGTSDGNDFAFASLLTGIGTYRVTVTAVNDCGTDSATFDFVLEDRLGPSLLLGATAVDCLDGRPLPEPIMRVPARAGGDSLRTKALVPPAPASALRELSAGPATGSGIKAESVVRGSGRIFDGRAPGFERPPEADDLDCATPCQLGTLSVEHPFYAVFVDCSSGVYTARTGASHPVTAEAGGFPQNVIFGGAGGNPGTSDLAWYLHELDLLYQNPSGGRACTFDPPDTVSEPNSLGLEVEWTVEPAPGLTLTLREEVVAFGTTAENSGVRLTLSARNETSSDTATTLGMRWQIDYQNAGDDGPLFATVQCDPPSIVATLDVEHELAPAEIEDFYRIQNNTGDPIFGNFTNTTAIAGIPDTGRPDRLVYGYWPWMRTTDWEYFTSEGNTFVDSDSAVLYYFGYRPADAASLSPGESVRRSVVIFTSGDSADCGAFIPGDGGDADLTLCAGDCAELSAAGFDACGDAALVLVGASAGAPACVGNPCPVEFPDPGTYTYTWEATDESGNVTSATTTVVVQDAATCATGGCDAAVVTPPTDPVICRGENAVLDGSGLVLTGCAGTVLTEWRDATGALIGIEPVIEVSPATTAVYTVTVWCDTDPTCRVEESVSVTVEQPPVAGVVRTQDLAPCNLGIEVSRTAAFFANPAGAVYNVYRSETSCADALRAPALVTGVTGTSWLDTTTTSGGTYFYAVEAEDGATALACVPSGPHHGGAADRACGGPVTDLFEGGFPEGVFATLFASHEGQEVTFEWSGARALLVEEHFHLLKAVGQPTARFDRGNTEGDLTRVFTETDTSSPRQFFDLRVANACEAQSQDEFPPGWDI